MMIGRFRVDEEGGYTGELIAVGLQIEDISFCPVKDKRADGADFIVIGYGEPPDPFEIDLNKYPPGVLIPNTNTYELGAAWKKISPEGVPRCLWQSFIARPIATPMPTRCWRRRSRASRRQSNSPNSPRRKPFSPR